MGLTPQSTISLSQYVNLLGMNTAILQVLSLIAGIHCAIANSVPALCGSLLGCWHTFCLNLEAESGLINKKLIESAGYVEL